ncbi:MAG: ASCH domain-containing protein [Actinomycetota bacterium]|nr:ASCH domain-containing protein [Actinomycetota bacterium]
MITTSVSLGDTPALLGAVRTRLRNRPGWDAALDRVIDPASPERAHLAVMHEPYLSYVLAGRKSVESRFSRHRVAPFDQVGLGDLLLLKSQSGPVTGVARVAHVDSYRLDPPLWASIRNRFSAALCVTDERFWLERREARYATLMRLAAALAVEPLVLDKRDRRPWVVLVPRATTEVHRDQLALAPEAPAEKRCSRTRLVTMYEAKEPDRADQLRLLE